MRTNKTPLEELVLVDIPNPQPFYQEGNGDANQKIEIMFVLTSSSSRFLWAASDIMLFSIHLIRNTKY